MSIELSLEDVKRVAVSYGLEFEVSVFRWIIPSSYARFGLSKSYLHYLLCWFVERKHNWDNLHHKS